MSRRNLSERQPAKNLGVNPPTRTVQSADGTVVKEKLNPMRFKRKMIDPAGNVIMLSLATGWTITSFKQNDYGVQILEEKMAKGFLPYSECPYAKGYLPIASGTKPCKGDDGRGGFKVDECCEHIPAIVETRRKAYAVKAERFNARARTSLEKMAEAVMKQSSMLNVAEQPSTGGPMGRTRE